MLSGLTVSERHAALFVLGALALVGLAMAVAGQGDPLAVHGYIVLAFSLALGFAVLSVLFAPETAIRLAQFARERATVDLVDQAAASPDIGRFVSQLNAFGTRIREVEPRHEMQQTMRGR